MSSIWISVHRDTSDHGLSQIFRSSREVVNGLTGIKNVLVNCLFVFNWS